MEKDKGNKKKPLKLSSSGRLQIRKNLGPSGEKNRSGGNKKTIQIVFKNKNNQQKSSSTTQSNFRGSSSLRSPRPSIGQSPSKIPTNTKSKNFENKNKKNADLKKNQPKKSTLKPLDDDFNKFDAKKILEQEEQEFDRFPSLAKIKRAREKEKLKTNDNEDAKISKEVSIPDIITVQDLANLIRPSLLPKNSDISLQWLRMMIYLQKLKTIKIIQNY